jgi:RNA polymerase sigma-70 factor (ECF subfamily)
MDAPPDSDLVQAARAGDARALEQLLLRYQPQLWRYARRMCGNVADAEDVLHNALLAALRGFAQYRGEAAPRTWLFSILRHACFRERRQRNTAGSVSADASATDDELAAADAASPERLASSRQLASAVVHAIDELEPAQRDDRRTSTRPFRPIVLAARSPCRVSEESSRDDT